MGMIPELRTAFCGCSVRTGSKVIGWVNMALGILEFIIFAAIIGMLLSTISSTDDEKLGEEALKVLRGGDDPEIEQTQSAETLRGLIVLMIGNDDETADPEVVGRQLKNQLQSIFTILFLVLLLFFLIHTLFTALLLVGVYKNKSGYVLFYLVLCILGLIGYVPLLFSRYASFSLVLSTLIGLFVHLYFTWVIYSFYSELRRSVYAAQTTTMLMPGQKHLDGDIPILIPTAQANYYYPQK